MTYPFVDLKEAVKAPHEVPLTSVVAFGGIPESPNNQWTPMKVHTALLDAVGQGSLLTFMNPKDRTRFYFAGKAVEDGHLWATRSIFITLLFSGIPRSFREALAYSNRFHLSWQERECELVMVTAQGSLRDWRKFLSHREDPAFKASHREIMIEAYQTLVAAGVSRDLL